MEGHVIGDIENALTETTLSKQPSRLRARWWWRRILKLRGLYTINFCPVSQSRDALVCARKEWEREGLTVGARDCLIEYVRCIFATSSSLLFS
jgi:hypothetical protein